MSLPIVGLLSLSRLCSSRSQGPSSSRQAEGQAERGQVLAGRAGRELILGRECSLQPGHHPSPVPSSGPGSPQHTAVPVSPAFFPAVRCPNLQPEVSPPGPPCGAAETLRSALPRWGSPFAAEPRDNVLSTKGLFTLQALLEGVPGSEWGLGCAEG